MLPGKKYGPQDFILLAKRYWLVIVVPAFIGLFAGLIVTASIPPTYRAEMLIQIVPQRVPDTYVRSTVTIRTEDRITALEAQVKSRSQLEALITEFDLYAAERAGLPMEDVVNQMRGRIDVELVRPGRNQPADSFYVRFAYGDPAKAARVVSRLGELFVNENARERSAMADGTNQFLESQLAEAQGRLVAHEEKMERFRKQHAGRLPSQADFNLQAIVRMQAELNSVVDSTARDRDQKLLVQQLYNTTMAEPLPPPTPTPTVAANPQDAASAPGLTLPQQLAAAEANLERLEGRLTNEHPDLRRARRQVADLQARVKAMPPPSETAPSAADGANPAAAQRRERLQQMRAQIESLDRQIAFKTGEEQRLRASIADYQARLEAVPGIESEWVALTRDYDTLQTGYKNLLQKSEESKVAADLERRQGGEQFRVLEAARRPSRPIAPMPLLINGVGLAGGAVLGFAMVALMFLRDRTLRTERDVLEALNLPVLAVVPLIEDGEYRAQQRRRMMLSAVVSCALLVAGGYAFWAMELWKHVI